jgi:hypothetical protein
MNKARLDHLAAPPEQGSSSDDDLDFDMSLVPLRDYPRKAHSVSTDYFTPVPFSFSFSFFSYLSLSSLATPSGAISSTRMTALSPLGFVSPSSPASLSFLNLSPSLF